MAVSRPDCRTHTSMRRPSISEVACGEFGPACAEQMGRDRNRGIVFLLVAGCKHSESKETRGILYLVGEFRWKVGNEKFIGQISAGPEFIKHSSARAVLSDQIAAEIFQRDNKLLHVQTPF